MLWDPKWKVNVTVRNYQENKPDFKKLFKPAGQFNLSQRDFTDPCGPPCNTHSNIPNLSYLELNTLLHFVYFCPIVKCFGLSLSGNLGVSVHASMDTMGKNQTKPNQIRFYAFQICVESWVSNLWTNYVNFVNITF